MREMSKVAKTANPTLSAQAQHITPFALRLRERAGCKENAKSRTPLQYPRRERDSCWRQGYIRGCRTRLLLVRGGVV